MTPLQIPFLNDWWDTHHALGGSVYTSDWPIQDLSSVLTPLLESFYALSFEEVLEFSEAPVTDNSMPNRNILEDASKIYYLVKEIKKTGLNFPPQLLHEPWAERYRIHPGSGRLLAMFASGQKMMKVIYIHFDEPGFTVPATGEIIKDATQLNAMVKQQNVDPHYTSYAAFDGFALEDSEWKPTIATNKPWRFLRYSEGPEFLNYKVNWRKCAIDLWTSKEL